MLVATGFLAFSATAQFGGLERAKGFKLILDYYSTPSGAQKKKSVLTGTEGNVLTSDTVYGLIEATGTYTPAAQETFSVQFVAEITY